MPTNINGKDRIEMSPKDKDINHSNYNINRIVIFRFLLIVSLYLTSLASQTCLCNSDEQTTSGDTDRPASTVSVNLYAKWRYTPVHLEASEMLASDNQEHFWNYINAIHDKYNSTRPIKSLNFEQLYNEVVEVAEEILDDSYQVPLLKFSLAHHISSPMIAAHEQIARDRLGEKIHECKALIELPQPPINEKPPEDESDAKLKDPYGTRKTHSDVNILCNSDDASMVFEKILSTDDYVKTYYQPTIYKSDHIYYAHNNPKAKKFEILTAVIYGEIGTEEFRDLYNYCKKMADLGKMNFVVRHLVPLDSNNSKARNRVSLGGYGVELAIKSTEYRAQDDTRVKGEASQLAEDEIRGFVEKPDEIEDLVFNELAKSSEEWKSTNPHFHEQILESIKQIPSINSSDIEDLSTQAVGLILSAPAEKQLALMRDLNQNFPIVAQSLVGEKVDDDIRKELEQNQMLFARFLNLAPTDAALFMNGMFFDVDALDMFALFEVVKNEFKELHDGTIDSTESDVERFLDKRYEDFYTKMVIEPERPNDPFLKMQVILDPLTRGAQKILPILMIFRKVFNIKLRFMFNCNDKHTSLPLKSFYRFVIESEPTFKNGPNSPPVLRTTFRNLPSSSLLTLNMATPENWLVESVRTPYDLDNIHLAELAGQNVYADFELEHLLLEGHCFDITNGSPPRGLQFVLGTQNRPALFDTIVMANLGYFQLKASPGAWNLRLRNGRSADIYLIHHVDGADFIKHQDPKTKSTSVVPALLNDFRSRFMKMRVHKKKDQRHRDLLSDEDEEDNNIGDIWGSIRDSMWSGSPDSKSIEDATDNKLADTKLTRTTEGNRLNIFSLASGHLYERLARIMMLSVLKNTNTPVKFWFLKNYLSPTFKDFLPYYAEKYNFDYELVQYKWPRWLHQQSEKQRIIWGYKILFLDVLFPLDVKKIIFVDADQVVRTDLKELRDLDLGGAPYGYTPFCDSRTDMDGFRFWKTGYWNSHLHGRKYHISALYVVDLQKFRKIAAGDRLRGQYQGLSQDPNSLSNLDQDLPNNMIHQVAIKSLPQEWLWCETWCSDEEKKKAKTIDLCNNPQTKEPKLTAARRIVAEWQDYDDEIKAIYEEFLKTQHKRVSESNKTVLDSHQSSTKSSLDQSPSTRDTPSKSSNDKQDTTGEKHEEL